jgi:hypothetical protein
MLLALRFRVQLAPEPNGQPLEQRDLFVSLRPALRISQFVEDVALNGLDSLSRLREQFTTRHA